MEEQDKNLNDSQDKLAVTIGKNLTRLRKMSGMTQLELAEKLNYSDKSISKWEQGNGIPDVRIVVRLAEMFNVSVDDLLSEHTEKPVMPKRERRVRRIIVTVLSVGICWLVAVAAFVFIGLAWSAGGGWKEGAWLSFVYAVPASAIVLTVFSSVWHWKWTRVVSISVLIWTVLACIYLTLYVCGLSEGMWLIFLIGVPLQILTLIFFVWKKRPNAAKE